MRDLARQDNKKIMRAGGAFNGSMHNGDPNFWTPQLLKKLMFFNYQKKNGGDLQNIYEESKNETRVAYEKRKGALEQLKKAMKAGN